MATSDAEHSDLVQAVVAGDVARVTGLLHEHPDRVREVTPGGCRLLSVAVRSGHLPVVRLLLERGADPTWPEAHAPGGRALHEAARAGRGDMVELLLRHGADPNVHVEASATPSSPRRGFQKSAQYSRRMADGWIPTTWSGSTRTMRCCGA